MPFVCAAQYTDGNGLGFLKFFTSSDGSNFTEFAWPIPQDSGGSMRDPSFFYNNNDGKFYLAYSLGAPSGGVPSSTSQIGVYSASTIGGAWTNLGPITLFTGGANPHTYAPAWFQDSNLNIYVVVAYNSNGTTSTSFGTYITNPASNANFNGSGWATPTLLLAGSGYDSFLVNLSGTYYLFTTQGTGASIKLWSASSLTGTYTTVSTTGLPNNESPVPFLIGTTWNLLSNNDSGGLEINDEQVQTASSFPTAWNGVSNVKFIVNPSDVAFSFGAIRGMAFVPVLPINDPITISDSVIVSLVSTGASTNIAITLGSRLGLGRAGGFPLGIGKAPVGVFTYTVSVGDTVSFVDVQTIYAPDNNIPKIYTDDLLVFSDSISVTTPVVGLLTQSVSDTFNNWADVVLGVFPSLFVAVSDTLTFLDNYNPITASAADNLNNWQDQVSEMLIFDVKVRQETITISDAFQVENQDVSGNIYGPIIGDLISFSDLVSFNIGIAENFSDSISITDNENRFQSDLVFIGDSITLTDFAGASSPTSPIIQPSDFFTISDFVQLLKTGFFTPSPTDILSFSDQLNLSLNQDEAKSDIVTITDTTIENLVILVSVADDLSLTDSSANNTPNLPTIVLSFGDGLVISDFVITQDGGNINVSDPFALVDGVGINDEVVVALSPSMNSYIRRYLNDIICPSNMGQGDN